MKYPSKSCAFSKCSWIISQIKKEHNLVREPLRPRLCTTLRSLGCFLPGPKTKVWTLNCKFSGNNIQLTKSESVTINWSNKFRVNQSQNNRQKNLSALKVLTETNKKTSTKSDSFRFSKTGEKQHKRNWQLTPKNYVHQLHRHLQNELGHFRPNKLSQNKHKGLYRKVWRPRTEQRCCGYFAVLSSLENLDN